MSPREQTLRLAVLDRARAILAKEGIAIRPLSCRDVEDATGISRMTVHRLETIALAKLRRRLREMEEGDESWVTSHESSSERLPHAP